jgi:hypothetical protein
MAYTGSGPLSPGSEYKLGDYTFSLANVVVEDDRVLQAHCTNGEESAAKGISVPTSAQLESWSVEADETEASVYATVHTTGDNPWDFPPFEPAIVSVVPYTPGGVWSEIYSQPVHAIKYQETNNYYVAASATSFTEDNSQGSIRHAQSFTYNGKTVYWLRSTDNGCSDLPRAALNIMYGPEPYIAWTMIYGSFEEEDKERLVARFAIDLADAGGGPGGGWIEPGDDGFGILHLTVNGALSGRHNDPIEDPTYSYIPADQDAVKSYGCGGDGGHGGGGGAGASTVVVHTFATDKADYNDVAAYAKRHGYGSGGGKGGTGGDGVILIYY